MKYLVCLLSLICFYSLSLSLLFYFLANAVYKIDINGGSVSAMPQMQWRENRAWRLHDRNRQGLPWVKMTDPIYNPWHRGRGGSYYDHVDFIVPHDTSDFTFMLSTSINQRASDEYMAFSDLKIYLETTEKSKIYCGQAIEHSKATSISCPDNQKISSIVFASYGTPTGKTASCSSGAYALGIPSGRSAICHSKKSKNILEKECIKKNKCTLSASNRIFGDNCRGVRKWLLVQYRCSPPVIVPSLPKIVEATKPATVVPRSKPTSCPSDVSNEFVACLSVPEKSRKDAEVGIIMASTAPGKLVYSLQSNEQGFFRIENNGGAITLSQLGSILDFETTPRHEIVVRVQDSESGLYKDGRVLIQITDVNEPPTFGISTGREINENSLAGTFVGEALLATDVDAGDSLTYTFTGGSGMHYFNISKSKARIAVSGNATLDHEEKSVLLLHVRATDSNGLYAGTTLVVTVNDVNEIPEFSSQVYNYTVGEHTQLNSPIGEPVIATDPDVGQTLKHMILAVEPSDIPISSFDVDSCSGQIRLTAPIFNYETQQLYTLTVQATDDGQASLFSTTTVYIEIYDENDAPILLSRYVVEIDENIPAGNIGEVIAATDEDANDSVMYAVTSQPLLNDLELFGFSSSSNGQLVLKHANIIDFETPSLKRINLQIMATDSGTPVQLSAEAEVTIKVLDVNEAPTWSILGESVLAIIDENSQSGSVIGQEVSTMVQDVDVGSILVYSLDSALACDDIDIAVNCNTGKDTGINVFSWFDIDEQSGQITLTEEALVNFEMQPKLRLRIRATDSGLGHLYAYIDVFVMVQDVPEPPQFAPLTTPKSIIKTLTNDYLSFSIDEYVPIGTVVVDSTTLLSKVYDVDVGDTFTFTQVYGTDGEAESITELSDTLVWNDDDKQLNVIPFWLSEEGVIHGWFDNTIKSVESNVAVPHASKRVRISLRYWSIGTWDALDNEEGKVSVDETTYWSKRRSSSVSCDGWNDLPSYSSLGLVAACFQDVEIEVDVSPSTPWQCLNNINVPVRMNEEGDVECYSKSNRHCMWGACNDALLIDANTHVSTSLSCGAEHKEKWRITGYAGTHWCNRGRNILSKSTSNLNIKVHGEIQETSGASKWGFSRFSVVSGGRDIGSEQPVFKVTRAGDIVTSRPIVYNDASFRTLSVEVVDSAGLTARATATVSINDINQAPLFSQSLYIVSVPENSIGGIRPSQLDDVLIQATDDDQDQTLTYSVDAEMTPVAADLFSVSTLVVNGESIAVILVKDNVDLDYETMNNYTLALNCLDSSGATASSIATIFLTDINEPPLPATDSLSFWVRGGTNQATVGNAITPNDPDADDEHDITIVSWKKCTTSCDVNPTFSSMALDAIPFAIDTSKFTLFVPSYIDASTAIENTDRFELLITVEDVGGYLKTVTVDVQVTFNNNAPVAVDQIVRVPENTGSYTSVGQVLASDEDTSQGLACNVTGSSPSIAQKVFVVEDLYMINAPGTTTHSANIMIGDLEALNMTIDFEEIKSFELNMIFFDDFADAPLHASASLIVQISDINEPPIVNEMIARSVAENSENVLIGGPIPVHDPEGQTLIFSIANTQPVPFTIDSTTGQLSTTSLNSAPFLDFEYQSSFDVEIKIVDSVGGHTIFTIVRVTVLDVNESPTISDLSIKNLPSSISEMTSDGKILGVVVANDVDADTVLSMSIYSSPIDNIFAISNTGVITLENPSNLDYESLATIASSIVFPATLNRNLEGSFVVSTRGCTGYLECQFITLTDATDFCQQESECTGIVHDTINTVINCERGFGCYYPRSGIKSSAYTGRTIYMKNHISDPLARLTITVIANDNLGLQALKTFNLAVDDANDIIISGISDLSPDFYDAEEGTEATFSTAGNEFVYFYGFNFGPENPTTPTSVIAYFGGNAQYQTTDCIVFSSNTVIRCTTSPGVGRELTLSITVGSYAANTDQNNEVATFSYGAPTVSSAPSVEAAYSEGQQGRCLDDDGKEPPSEKFFVGSDSSCRQLCSLCSVRDTCEACNAYDWNVRSLKCRLYATKMSKSNGKPRSRCYQKLTSSAILAFRTVGGDPFVLSGTNFGPIGTIVAVFYGPAINPMTFAAMECLVIISHTRISCVSAPGVGSNLVVTVSVGGQTAQPSSGLLTYAAPIIEDIAISSNDGSSDLMDIELMPPQNFPTFGGTLVDITGINFPPINAGVDIESILHVSYGPTGSDFNALNCRVIQDGMVIRCEVAPGYGANHYWRVNVAELVSGLSPVKTSYLQPSINTCFGPACLKSSTAGGQLLVLFGQNLFGPLEYVVYGSGTGTLYAASCTVLKPHVALACLTAPGTGKSHKWTVRIGEQNSEASAALTNYAAPALNMITGEGSSNANTLGGQLVRIEGTNFPPMGSTLSGTNTIVTYTNGIQTFEAENCKLVYKDLFSSAGYIDCLTVASTGDSLTWDVTVDGQISVAPTTSTAPPTVSHIQGYDTTTATTQGGTEFSLVGSEFGNVGLSSPNIKVTYGPTATEYIAEGCSVTQASTTGNSTITCASAEGSGKNLAVMVTVTDQESDIYTSTNGGVLFSYASPSIIAISETMVNTGSEHEIQLFGKNFGDQRSNTTVTYGGGKVSRIRHVSHVEIRFVVPDWQTGREKPIVVTVSEQISNAMYLGFNSPVIYDIGQSSEFTSKYQGTTIYINGHSFGASSSTGRVLIDGMPCVVNEWMHTRIECETLDLEGELQVIVGEQVSNTIDDFSVTKFLRRPIIDSLSIYKGDPQGGYLVTLIGSDFADDTVSTVMIGNKACEVNSIYPGSIHEDTRITCLVPSGEGRVNVTVSVDWRTSLTTFFEYTNPIIDTQIASDHTTLGGALITLQGRHLGDVAIVWWDGVVSVDTRGTSIGANGSKVSTNATSAFCGTGCVDKKMSNPCTHPSCMACQWYLTNYCNQDSLFGDAHDNELCSDECVASEFSLASEACTVPLLRVVAQCPSELTNKSDIVIVNQSSTEVNFIAPPGEGRHHEIQLVQMGDIKSNIQLFDYDPPVLDRLSTSITSTQGGEVLMVYGTDFGENPKIIIEYRALEYIVYNDTDLNSTYTSSSSAKGMAPTLNNRRFLLDTTARPKTRIITTRIEECDTIEQTHETVSCIVPPGQGNLHLIQVDAAGQRSNTTAFGYAGPTLYSVTPNSGDTKGNFEIILNGTNFGLKATLTIGNRSATILQQNHTHIIALAPGGKGLNNSVVVDVQDQISNSLNLEYLPPSISLVYPNPANAHDGELITIEGRNFGSDSSDVSVQINGLNCTNAQWVNLGQECNKTDSNGKPACHPVIQCITPPQQKIGGVSVYVRVAEQEVYVDGEDTPILTLSCPFNMYGVDGELCKACPVGALCPGKGNDPISLAGWWSVDVDTFVKCIPAKACVGNNTCAAGYADSKYCSQCEAKTETTPGFYRQDLSCHECTDLAIFWFTTAIVSILFFIILIWILTTWEFRLASLNIMMDFLQVMALCASIKLNWSAAGDNAWTPRLIEGSTLFAFNLQGFMPACVIEGWNYEFLWWYLMLTPPFVFILVMLASMLHLCGGNRRTVKNKLSNNGEKKLSRVMPGGSNSSGESKHSESETDGLLSKKKKRHRRKHKRRRAKSGMINAHAWGAYMILMYYCFAPLVTRVWEPFDCTEFKVGGNKSFFTMEADPTEQCFGSTDGTYWTRLAVFAGFLGIFYTFVAPIMLFLTFYRFRHAIEKDLIRSQTHETEGQSWRADLAAQRIQSQVRGVLTRKTHGTGWFFSRKTVVHDTSIIRKHYGKLYEDFRPEFYYWRFILMLRKVLISFVIFFPSTSPVFQATVAIVILFTFFVLQVKYQPYLQRATHPVSSNDTNSDFSGIKNLFGSAFHASKEKGKKEEKTRLLGSGTSNGDDNDLAKKRWKKAILITRTEIRWHTVAKKHGKDLFSWLFDYNSLEMMALACAIMVLLNGIMLETNSLRAPVLGVLKIAPEALTKGFVNGVDILTVVMFLIPCTFLPLSIIIDVWRNIAFANHNRIMEKRKREVALVAARVKASAARGIESKIEQWRSVQKAKLERNLSLHDKDHIAIMQVGKIQYEEDRLDLDDEYKRLVTQRITYTEFQALLRNKTPANATDAERLGMDLKKVTMTKSALEDRLLEVEDEMKNLDQEYRIKSSRRQQEYAQKRSLMNLQFQEALRKKIETGDNSIKQSKLSGVMPVQLQMKVLVSQRKFDDKSKSLLLVKAQMAQLERSLGADAAGELMERANLEKELQVMEYQVEDHQDTLHNDKQEKLNQLEFSTQDLFGKQKEHSSKMHQIDMAAEAHRRALEKELGPVEVRIFFSVFFYFV